MHLNCDEIYCALPLLLQQFGIVIRVCRTPLRLQKLSPDIVPHSDVEREPRALSPVTGVRAGANDIPTRGILAEFTFEGTMRLTRLYSNIYSTTSKVKTLSFPAFAPFLFLALSAQIRVPVDSDRFGLAGNGKSPIPCLWTFPGVSARTVQASEPIAKNNCPR
jgi:hypothetical protein